MARGARRLGLGLAFLVVPVVAQAALTVTPLTWNVIGLDSNSPTAGPKNFPVGARVCSDIATTNVTANFVFDSANANINLRPGSLAALNFPSLAAGACADAYYEVEVTQVAAAYDTTRRYHISASDPSGTYSTPLPRELYVEHLISQSRNSINNVKYGTSLANLVSVAAGGALNLVVGNTYIIELDGGTATQGYEQFESFINFSNAIFQILAVDTSYSADSSPYVPNPSDKLYADACLWENDPNSPNYRSCVGVDGKAGGSNVVTRYTVKIIGGGGTAQTLNTLLDDFSGSSFHYNGDYSAGARIGNIIDPTTANISKAFSPNPAPVNGVSALTITLTNPNAGALSGYNFTDNLPAGMTIATPAGATTAGCGTPTLTATAGTGTISFSGGTVAGNGSCVIKVDVTTSVTGTYVNTTGHLFIDSVDTNHTATATLTVNNAPPPGTGICGQALATWRFPTGFNINAPAATSSTVTAVTAIGAGMVPISETTITADGTAAWGSNGSITTGAPLATTNNEYFEFGVDTTGLTSVALAFNAQFRSANGPKGVAVFYGTSNARPETGTVLLNNAAALATQNTPAAFSVTASSGLNSAGTTYFRIYSFNSNNTNPGSDPVLDDVVITGCGAGTPATIAKSFSPNPIAVNGVSTLTFTLANPNSVALTGAAFTDALPGGTQVAATPAASTTCGGTWAPAGGATSLAFSGGTIPAGGTCAVNVNVTATTAGPHANISGFLSTTEAGTNTTSVASATLTALSPPQIAKGFSPSPIIAGGVSRLTFSLVNPNPNDAIAGVAFSDTLPTIPGSMVVASTPNAATAGCGAPTFAPTAGAAALAFSGGSIAAGGSCSVSVDVVAPAVGIYNNTSGPVSFLLNAQVVNGNTASASLVVGPPHPAIGLLKQVATSATGPWLSYAAVPLPGNVYYQFTIENDGDVPLSPVTLSDPQVNTSSCVTPGSLPVAVAANNNHIFTCVVGPVAAVAGTHPNTATANGTGAGNPVGDTDSAIYASATMSLAKSVTEASYTAAGDTLHYSYLVTNTGAATLDGPITVNDNKATVTCPALATIGNGDNFFNPGEALTCTATYVVTPADVAAASVTNTAQASNGTITSNTDSRTVPLSSSADVSVVKMLVTPGPYLAGQSLAFTLVVANAGPSTATGIQVTDTPSNLTITSVSGAGCSAFPCTIASLAGGANVTISVTATIVAAGPFDNAATVSAAQPDPNLGNNTDNTGNGGNAAASADLAVTKTDGVTSYTPGGTTTYTIVATNNGPSGASGATIIDSFDASFTGESWTAVGSGGASGFSAAGTGSINEIVDMPVGSSITYTVSATISFGATGNLSNTATVSVPAGVTDPVPGNNSATDVDSNGGTPQLSIAKSATPAAFAVGQTGTYSLLVSNTGSTSTVGTITVADTLPSGITTTATPTGTGWNCGASTATSISCTTPAVLLPGGNAPVINAPITVAVGTASPAMNTATVVGGGDATCPAATAHCASTISTPVNAPLIDISKTLQGSLVVGVPTNYVITATNNGQAATLAGTITDTIPTGLTIGTLPGGCSATGQNITCTLPAGIATGGSVPYTIPVTPQASVNGTNVSNTATGNGGGDPSCPAATHCNDTITDTVMSPQLSLTKTASPASFVVNQPATYTLTLTNVGNAATTATTTITDTIPGGLTIGTLPAACSAVAQTVTCTIPAPLATGTPVTFTIPVTPTNALNGTSVTNTAGATDGGDPGCPAGTPVGSLPARCVGTVTNAVDAPQLTITKSASAPAFVVGVAASYTLQVVNTGSAPTNASATVTDVVPASLTIGTLPAGCTSSGQQVTCTIASGLATGSSVSFVIPVTPTAGAMPSVSNTASVLGGGDPTCPTTSNCSSTTTTPVDAPQLTIVKTASAASFVVGVAASYTLQVTNTGTAATTASATVIDNVPASLTIGTLPAGCSAVGQTVTCTIAAGLASGNSASFVIPVTPTAAANGTSLSNTASVSGGGDPTCPAGANCSSTITTPVDAPALQIVKTASASNFVVGVAASYTLQVTNTGTAPTTAAATVSDNIPGSLTIGTLPAGCTAAGQTVTCTIAAGLATGAPVSFVIPVTPTAAASGTTLSNTATVSGGGDPSCPGGANCTSTVTTPVDAPALQIVKTASTSNFVVGVPASYTLTVTNTGSVSTTAVTTITDNVPGTLAIGTLPAGCSATAQAVTCTIAAGLASNSPVSFVIPVTPTAAASGSTLTNTATVSGGGDPSCPGGAACSSTVTTPVNAPQLQVVKSASGAAFTVGVPASYTLAVTNVGSAATTATTTVTDNVPAALTIGTVPAGCTASGQSVTCTIPAGLATNAPVSFVIPVTPTAAASGSTLTNTATVSGGGDPSCPGGANCSSTVTTPVDQPKLHVVKTASATNFVVGTPASYTLTVTNIGSAATTAVANVTDNVPANLAIGTLPGGCTAVGQAVTCTIAAGLATGTPVSFVIPVTPTAAASGATLSNMATISGGGDPSCPNASDPDCSSTVTTPVDAPALRIVKTASSSSFTVGVAASYTLAVTNIGGAATTAVATITDNVPATLSIGTPPAGCTFSAQNVTCTIAAGFAAGSTTGFVIPVTPTAGGGATVSNTATVSGGGDPTCPGNANCTSTVTTPVGAPQLQVVKTASSATFTIGTAASYTLTVTNTGSAATTAVATVSDNVPAALTLGAPPAGCSASGQQVSCTIAAGLAPSTPVAFTIPVTPTAAAGGTTLVNTAIVSGGGDPTCPAGPSCSSTVATPVPLGVTSSDLRIVKTGPATVDAGQDVVYSISVTNMGPDTAIGVVLSDPAPAGLAFVSSGAPCAAFPCNLGDIALNQTVTIAAVTFHVPTNYAGTSVINVASVASTTPDPTPNNNSSSVSTTIVAIAPPVSTPVPIDARWMLLLMLALLGGAGIVGLRWRHCN